MLKFEYYNKTAHSDYAKIAIIMLLSIIIYIYIYIYIYICYHENPPGYHHNGFVATHALGHMMHMLILMLFDVCQKKVLRTFPGSGYIRSEDGVV